MQTYIFSLHYASPAGETIDPSHFGPYSSLKEAYDGFLRTGEKMDKKMSNDLPIINWYYDLTVQKNSTYEQVTFAELGQI